jgi:hypothetical protein
VKKIMFNIESVSNLEWCDAEQTSFRCMVKYAEFSEVLPVGVNGTDPYSHIQELWNKGRAGVYGPIAPYIPPPEPPAPPSPEAQPTQTGAENF